MKENFESVSFTPITAEKFAQHVASVEQAAEDSNSSNVPFSPRLSLSSRFLSRSHFGAGRYVFCLHVNSCILIKVW